MGIRFPELLLLFLLLPWCSYLHNCNLTIAFSIEDFKLLNLFLNLQKGMHSSTLSLLELFYCICQQLSKIGNRWFSTFAVWCIPILLLPRCSPLLPAVRSCASISLTSFHSSENASKSTSLNLIWIAYMSMWISLSTFCWEVMVGIWNKSGK